MNHGTIGAEAHLPFGGTKATGNGHREVGQAALDFFSEWKSVYIDYSREAAARPDRHEVRRPGIARSAAAMRLPYSSRSTSSLFPHLPLPLHVFEERYRAMTRDLLADGSPFAGRFVVMITTAPR